MNRSIRARWTFPAAVALSLSAGLASAQSRPDVPPRGAPAATRAEPATGATAPGNPPTSVAQTRENLKTAIEGEANAAYRYRLFAERADREGYRQVASLFLAAAESESIHRRNHEQALVGLGGSPGSIELEQVQVRSTRENLRGPIEGERNEESEMYPRFVQEARRVGADPAAKSFEDALVSERQHEALFSRALAELGRNPDVAYYVSSSTGKTFARPLGAEPPAADRPGERFLRVE